MNTIQHLISSVSISKIVNQFIPQRNRRNESIRNITVRMIEDDLKDPTHTWRIYLEETSLIQVQVRLIETYQLFSVETDVLIHAIELYTNIVPENTFHSQNDIPIPSDWITTIDVGETIYHGSTRISVIRNYIQLGLPHVFEYIQQHQNTNNITTKLEIISSLSKYYDPEKDDDNIYMRVHDAMGTCFGKFESFMPGTNASIQHPWTVQIVAIYFIKYIQNYYSNYGTNGSNLTNVLFEWSSLIQEFIMNPNNQPPNYNLRKAKYNELISLFKILESFQLTDQNKDVIIQLFDMEFFSSMRMPVHFFSQKHIAMEYAKEDEKQLFTLQVNNKPIRLLNISHPDVIRDLFETVFDSTEPYPKDLLKYYTELKSTLTLTTIWDSIVKYYFEEVLAPYPEFQEDNRSYSMKYILGLIDTGNATTGPSITEQVIFDELQKRWKKQNNPPSGKGEEYDFIYFIVSDLYQNAKGAWRYLQYAFELENQSVDFSKDKITNEIMSIYIQDKLTYGEETNFYSFVAEGQVHDFFQADSNFFTPMVTARLVKDKKKVLKQMIEESPFDLKDKEWWFNTIDTKFNFKNKGNIPLYDEFEAEGHKHMGYSLLSPYGMWTCIHYLHLLKNGKSVEENTSRNMRLSWFNLDVLIIYTLIHSSWFKNSGLDGWVSEKQYELMVVHPMHFGQLVAAKPLQQDDIIDNVYDDKKVIKQKVDFSFMNSMMADLAKYTKK